MNLTAYVIAGANSADFRLLVSVTNTAREPIATIASIPVDDPNLGERLRDIAQAFRMGTRYGVEND